MSHIPTADVLIAFAPIVSVELLRQGKSLRWIQALGTGTDGISDQTSVLPQDIVITNMQGIHGPVMSEAAVSAMLSLARRSPAVHENQRLAQWKRFPVGTLSGKTVAIIGLGTIAETLAPLCKAFGMTVIGVSNTPRTIPGFDDVLPRAKIDEALAKADYVVLLTPATPGNNRLINAARLACMKRSAYLVNLARGSVIDEPALLEALQTESIAGAALDVFETEPLPEGHPLWFAKNTIITPHLGGFFDGYPEQALPIIVKNLELFLNNDTRNMINLVRHP